MNHPQVPPIVLFERMLTQRFADKGLLSKSLNDPKLALDAYACVREACESVFSRAEFSLCEASKKFVISKLFGCTNANGELIFKDHELAKARASEVPTNEARFLLDLFYGSVIEDALEEELKRRG